MAHSEQDLWESELITCYKSWEGPVDPASNEDHGKHIGDISLHHVCQHAGICEKTQCWPKYTQYSIVLLYCCCFFL